MRGDAVFYATILSLFIAMMGNPGTAVLLFLIVLWMV
jgi:hypothetical protein